jgi:signal transduction histidine kinase
LPTLLADETRVRQVLLNLLSNACKFTDRGAIGMGARIEGAEVLVWVRDSGIGIAPADQARIFGEFEQAESDDRRKRGGTGLGLSICRWLIELHGGRMGVKSEPGKGSVFYFTLPLVCADEPALAPA